MIRWRALAVTLPSSRLVVDEGPDFAPGVAVLRQSGFAASKNMPNFCLELDSAWGICSNPPAQVLWSGKSIIGGSEDVADVTPFQMSLQVILQCSRFSLVVHWSHLDYGTVFACLAASSWSTTSFLHEVDVAVCHVGRLVPRPSILFEAEPVPWCLCVWAQIPLTAQSQKESTFPHLLF